MSVLEYKNYRESPFLLSIIVGQLLMMTKLFLKGRFSPLLFLFSAEEEHKIVL